MGVVYLAEDTTFGRKAALKALPPDLADDPERIFEVAIPLADALATAHAKGIIHWNLKPDNVMVGSQGQVKGARLRPRQTVGWSGSADGALAL